MPFYPFNYLYSPTSLEIGKTKLVMKHGDTYSIKSFKAFAEDLGLRSFNITITEKSNLDVFHRFIETIKPKVMILTLFEIEDETREEVFGMISGSSLIRFSIKEVIHTKYLPDSLEMLSCDGWEGDLREKPNLTALQTVHVSQPDQLDHIVHLHMKNGELTCPSEVLESLYIRLVKATLNLDWFPNLQRCILRTEPGVKLIRTTPINMFGSNRIPDFEVVEFVFARPSCSIQPREVFERMKGLRKLILIMNGETTVYGSDTTLCTICV